MTGFGGMVCFDLEGSYERAEKLYDRLKSHQARREPRRRRESDQHAGADVTVGPLRRSAPARRA